MYVTIKKTYTVYILDSSNQGNKEFPGSFPFSSLPHPFLFLYAEGSLHIGGYRGVIPPGEMARIDSKLIYTAQKMRSAIVFNADIK